MFLHEARWPATRAVAGSGKHPERRLAPAVGHRPQARPRRPQHRGLREGGQRKTTVQHRNRTSLIEARLISGDEKLFAKFQKTVAGQMRRGPRGGIHRRAPGGPGRPAGQVRQLGLHAGAQPQERLRRPARFSEPALDGVLQIPHPLAQGAAGARTRQARASASNWKPPTISCCACAPRCITTSTAPMDVLRQEPPARRRPQPRLPRTLPQQAHRGVHARRLHPLAQHLPHHPHPGTAPGAPAADAGCSASRCAGCLPSCSGGAGRRPSPWTASSSSTGKSTPPPTASSATSRAGSCACSSTPSSAACACTPTSRSSSATSLRWWTARSSRDEHVRETLPRHPQPARQRRAHPARDARGGSARQIPPRVRQAHLPGAARVLPPIHRRRAHADVPRATGPRLGGQGARPTPPTPRSSRSSSGPSCSTSRCCSTTSAKPTATATTPRSARRWPCAPPDASASTPPPPTPCAASSSITC